MSSYDFSGLTTAQVRLLQNGGWHVSDASTFTQPSKRTVIKLIERGLLVETLAKRDGGLFYVSEYDVPAAVRAAFAARKAVRK